MFGKLAAGIQAIILLPGCIHMFGTIKIKAKKTVSAVLLCPDGCIDWLDHVFKDHWG